MKGEEIPDGEKKADLSGEPLTETTLPEDMEVHHHPQLPHGERKKFGEYLLEFLMIFLAVSLGFFAENIRERWNDREKEEQYAKSFVNNLEEDTARLGRTTEFIENNLKGLDSFLAISKNDFTDLPNRKMFYYFSVNYLFSEELFRSNDATLAQLRNSGGYRLIRKDHVADSIALYESKVNFLYGQGDYYSDFYKQTRALMDEIMDLTVLQDSTYIRNHRFTEKILPPLLNDPQRLKLFFNKMEQLRIAAWWYCHSPSYLNGLTQYAGRLIVFLRKEYEF
jgi:hypothetical protein